jgi:hypothetical protein
LDIEQPKQPKQSGVKLEPARANAVLSQNLDSEFVYARAREFCTWTPAILIEQFGAENESDEAIIAAVAAHFDERMHDVAVEGCRRGLLER